MIKFAFLQECGVKITLPFNFVQGMDYSSANVLDVASQVTVRVFAVKYMYQTIQETLVYLPLTHLGLHVSSYLSTRQLRMKTCVNVIVDGVRTGR